MNSIIEAVYLNSIRYPDKTALICEGQALSYREFYRRAAAFAAFLKIHKVRKGARVGLKADDLTYYFPAFLGCQLAGVISVPLERSLSEESLCDLIRAVKPERIFPGEDDSSWSDFFKEEQTFPFPPADNDCAIISTTGTTGSPERILHTNRSMLCAVENLAVGTKITADSVLLVSAPFNLAFGYRRVFAALYAGACAVLRRSLEPLEDFFAQAAACHVSHLALIPSDFSRLLHADPEKMNETARQLKAVQTAIFPVSARDKNEFLQRYPSVTLYNVYGTTEAGCCLINNCSQNPADACLGKASLHAQVDLQNKAGELITKPGEYGYIAIRGDMNMKGYYKKKALTDRVKVNGSVITSDVAYYGEDGSLYYVGRINEIINVHGRKVIPDEVERVASEFPGVQECACVAQDSAEYGQLPKLFVVFDSDADPAKLREYLADRLEYYKVPAAIEVIDKIPRTATGKILRRHLAALC